MNIQGMVWILNFIVYVATDQSTFVTGSRRPTTMENVQAIYNRFTRTSNGKATYYGEYPSGGLCSLDPPPPMTSLTNSVKIAVSKEDFQKSLGCGMCVEIQGLKNPSAPDLKGTTPVKGVVKGMIYDLCGSCKQGDVDLYLPGNGVWDITMKAIDCPSLQGTVGYIQFKFTGSNEWYFKLQARNARIPVAGVEVYNTVTSEWYCLKRTDDNYFTNEGLGKVTFPIQVRLTSITNEKLETTIKALKNDEAFASDVQFSGFETRGGSPVGIQCFGQGHKSTKDTGPETDEKFCAGKADGTYADPVDCSAYYECSKGKSSKKYCSSGLKFNAMKGKCDKAENVVCPNEKRGILTNKRFVKYAEAESIEMRDMSPRSVDKVIGNRRRIKGLHKKRHRHHYHKGMKSNKHRKHSYWRKTGKRKGNHLHRRKLHLKNTGAKIHQGFKRTPEKIHQGFKRTPEKIHHGFKRTPEKIHQGFKRTPEKIHHGFKKTPEKIHQGFKRTPEKIHHGFKRTPEKIHHGFKRTPEKIHQGFKRTPEKIHHGFKRTPEEIHQGFKRIPNKKLNVKVKVQLNGPNLSGEFETKDPSNPKEGTLTVSAVENAEEGDESLVQGKNITTTAKNDLTLRKNGHGDVPVLAQNTKTPTGFSAGVPNGSPFNFGDDLQFDYNSSAGGTSDNEQSKMAEAVVMQASRMDDGAVQTSTTIKPQLNIKEKANGVSNDELINPAVSIQALLKDSFTTKPQVIYLKKEADSKSKNGQVLNVGISVPNVTKPQTEARKNTTLSQGTKPQSIQRIMEALNLIKSIKLNTNRTNVSDARGNDKKGVEHELKENKNANKVYYGGNPKESLKENQFNVQNGAKASGNESAVNSQEPKKSVEEKAKSISNLNKQEGSFGILFIVNRTKNDSKQQEQVLNPIGNQVSIIPNIDNKAKQITDKANEKTGSNIIHNATAGSEPTSKAYNKGNNQGETTKDEQSKATQDNVVKNIHHSIQKAGSIAGLVGLIGDLVKTKLHQNETVDSAIAASNGTADTQGKNGNVANGKVNISLRTVAQGGTQENSDQGKTFPNNLSASKEQKNTKSDFSNRLRTAEGMNKTTKENNLSKSNVSDLQGKTGPILSKPVSIQVPVMRIRLKGPATKSLDAAQIFQDEVLSNEGKHRGIFINDEDGESFHKGKPLRSTTVIIRHYNKDDKHANYETEDTLPMAGSEDFDAYGNRKIAQPMISMSEANSLLNVDKTLLDNAAIHNVLYNPSLTDTYPEQKEDNMKTGQQNGFNGDELKGEAEEFSHALKHQDDEPRENYKTVVKAAENILHHVPYVNSGDRFGNIHGSRIEENELPNSAKPPKGTVVSNYDGNQMGTEKHRNYMDGMGDMSMAGNMDGMDEMQGMNGMEGRMQGMNGMGGGMRGMNGMGGGMGGMNGMGGGMQGMNGMGGGMQGMGGMSSGTEGMGKGTAPVAMQVLGGSQDDINKGMNQALANMQDMAMKQIQSKYPGMPITMKVDDGGDESGEEPTAAVQHGSGENQSEPGSASSELTSSAQPLTIEVFSKHKERKNSNGKKELGNSEQKEQSDHINNQQTVSHDALNDQKSKHHNDEKESQQSEDHTSNDAISDNMEKPHGETVSSQNEDSKTGRSSQKLSKNHEDENKPSQENQDDQKLFSNEHTAADIETQDLCKERTSGVYASKQDPSKFIICYNGITEERQCADGMVFNPREKVCEASSKQKGDVFQDKSKASDRKNNKSTATNSRNTKKISFKKTGVH